MAVWLVTFSGLSGTFVQKILAVDAAHAADRAKHLFRFAPILAVDYGWPYVR